MPDMDGIQTGKTIREYDRRATIVFVTSYEQYALQAFECEAFNYLLKPASKEKIQKTPQQYGSSKREAVDGNV